MGEVLQLSDIVKVTGLPAHTVRQWSIGRPYQIGASVRGSSHRGVPKLFSADDALKFMVGAQLTRDGFASHAIKVALDRLDAHAHAETLEISGGRARLWNVIPSIALAAAEPEKRISIYVLNLRRLRTDLNRKIATREGN